ncbi:hemoglobin, alpha embryonic 5 [Pygocentrus nattereri]|uniref:Globin domain-containing protein n=1 Tax=Pygocentrus nattereri TaxID=42514 RepID=A0A3B4DQK6_PYGNA|nr:hemoglobin, alpha embryonic 5 [Pygocentrus nattereri]
MSLSDKDKRLVKAFWAKVAPKAEVIGHDALYRMLSVYPQTKTYFSHWPDISSGSAPVKNHGKKIMGGLAEAVAKIDDLVGGLLTLSELHAFQMRVDPNNYKILTHCILVVLAVYFPEDLSPEVHLAFEKFLTNVALAMSDKYR